MAETAIELRDLDSESRAAARRASIYLRKVSLDIARGEAVGLVGAVGLRQIDAADDDGGARAPRQRLDHHRRRRARRLSEDALATFRGARIGIVFQAFHLIPTMTALENVAAPLELAGASDAFAARRRRTGRGRARRAPVALSGAAFGRRAAARRAGARAGAAPFAADRRRADRQSRRGDRDARSSTCCSTCRAERGATLVLVTHDLALAARCDRTIRAALGVRRDGRAGGRVSDEPIPGEFRVPAADSALACAICAAASPACAFSSPASRSASPRSSASIRWRAVSTTACRATGARSSAATRRFSLIHRELYARGARLSQRAWRPLDRRRHARDGAQRRW